MAQAEQMELTVIIKTDVQGSAEALSDALLQLDRRQGRVRVVHSASAPSPKTT